MKHIIICLVAITGAFSMSSCVNERPQRKHAPHVVTTTTQETTVRSRPTSTTVETQNVRSY